MRFSRKNRRGIVIGCLILPIAAALAIDRVVAFKVNELTRPRRTSDYTMVDERGGPIRRVTLRTADGLELCGWHKKSRNGATIILQHGYRANSGKMLGIGLALARHGYGVLWFDFRGHGKSQGDLVTFGRAEVADTNAAVAFVESHSKPGNMKIGLLGNSMGGATAILAAAENALIQAVAVEGVFAELSDEVGIGIETQTGLPACPLDTIFTWCAERQTGSKLTDVSPVSRIGRISPRAILILQGGQDVRIPTNSGQRLFEAAGEPKQLWFEPTAPHSGFSKTVLAEYERRVLAFFDQHLLGRDFQSTEH